jgi:hypothetical protein
MKVSAILKNKFYQNYKTKVNYCLSPQNDNIHSTTFGIANAGKLKILFSYGVPCMYSGIEMIDSPRVQKLMKNDAFKRPLIEVLKIFENFETQLCERERRILKILKEESLQQPYKTLKETFESLAKIHRKRLRKKQAPIFQQIIKLGHELPEEYRYRFNRFMVETEDKLDEKEILILFSTTEFKYKLQKIKEDVEKQKNNKAIKVLNKMIKETERLPKKTSAKTEEHQAKIINFLEIIKKRSILKDYEPLEILLSNAKARLSHEKIKTPFSRKSFIYDLDKLLKDCPDKGTVNEILAIAELLPTSKDSISAYIIKSSYDPSEKIAFRLLWPSIASIEHILPKSRGGADIMSNFGGATTKENSERLNIDFCQQIKRKPQTKFNSQKYINKIIELARNGIFKKHNIDINYIRDFKKTIQKQSKGAIVLDIFEYEKNRG